MTWRPDAMSRVSRTALSVARVRSSESGRPDPLFVDPSAVGSLSAPGSRLLPDGLGRAGGFVEEVRTAAR
ncbi:hypothetical protein ACIGXI_02720 [Kitasatospora aureofaciens]|uniref:hypothetical protein n=1 Tax=Kitasatospora aureofaciens TaxID=1894 RepID=UPI0037C93FE5